jgi:hypothetical protein
MVDKFLFFCSISGITPGAALEKKSVRDIAANFAANKLGKFQTFSLIPLFMFNLSLFRLFYRF